MREGQALGKLTLEKATFAVLTVLVVALSSFCYVVWQEERALRESNRFLQQQNEQLKAENLALGHQVEEISLGVAYIVIENVSIPLFPMPTPVTSAKKYVPILGDITFLLSVLNDTAEKRFVLNDFETETEFFNNTCDIKVGHLAINKTYGYIHIVLGDLLINVTTPKGSNLYDFEIADITFTLLKGNSVYVRGYLRNISVPTEAGYRMNIYRLDINTRLIPT